MLCSRDFNFLKAMLQTASSGKLVLCGERDELPIPYATFGDPIPLTIGSLRVLRRQATGAATAARIAPERQQEFVTGVGEAAMNAVMHAGGGMGRVTLDSETKRRVQVWVEDSGLGIPMHLLYHTLSEVQVAKTKNFGMGFGILLYACDRLYLQTDGSGTTIVLECGSDALAPGEKPGEMASSHT